MMSVLAVKSGFLPQPCHNFHHELFQLRVLRLRSDENGNVRVGVFPEREEILIGRLGFGGVALHGIGSADLEMRECTDGFVEHNSAMVEDFLELGGGFAALMRGQIGFAAHKDGIQGVQRKLLDCRLPSSYGVAALRLSMASEVFPRLTASFARRVGR